MDSLHHGFWPLDEGNWKDDEEDFIQNYSSSEVDLEAIRSFRDDQIKAGRWSEPLPSKVLLPGMKLSPIFVVWQKGKVCVVTDHTASGLNDYIPQSEATVHYDDMQTFGQVIFNAKQAHSNETLVTWKSDVSSAGPSDLPTQAGCRFRGDTTNYSPSGLWEPWITSLLMLHIWALVLACNQEI
jgi:hypothetical protein